MIRHSADPVLLGGGKMAATKNSATEQNPEVAFAMMTTSAGSSNVSVDTVNGSKPDVTDSSVGIQADSWIDSLATVSSGVSGIPTGNGCSVSIASVAVSQTCGISSGSGFARLMADCSGRKSAINDTTSFTSHQLQHVQQRQRVILSPTNPFSTATPVTVSISHPMSDFRSNQRPTSSSWRGNSTTTVPTSAVGSQPSDWAFSEVKSVTSVLPSGSSVTSSVRGTLLRLQQPAVASPSGERDTDKLLQTTDDTSSTDEKLVVL